MQDLTTTFVKPPKKKQIKVVKEKKVIETAHIDWANLPSNVTVIGANSRHLVAGAEYIVTKAQARVLLSNGAVTLK